MRPSSLAANVTARLLAGLFLLVASLALPAAARANHITATLVAEKPAAPGGEVKDTRAALCRCGGSSNKPFCDGTHRNGFQAEGGQKLNTA
mgnify:CR=1 FL=1